MGADGARVQRRGQQRFQVAPQASINQVVQLVVPRSCASSTCAMPGMSGHAAKCVRVMVRVPWGGPPPAITAANRGLP